MTFVPVKRVVADSKAVVVFTASGSVIVYR